MSRHLQSELLGNFIRKWEAGIQAWTEIAHAYVDCINAGIDMTDYVSPSMGEKLKNIVSGKLIDSITHKIHLLPDVIVNRMATLPKPVQQEIWDKGALIKRGEKAERVKPMDMTGSEVRRLIDVLDGKGRILTPAEQEDRKVPNVQKRDHEVKVRLPYEVVTGLGSLASKANKSLEAYIRDLLKQEVG